jgi:hypothetical protein
MMPSPTTFLLWWGAVTAVTCGICGVVIVACLVVDRRQSGYWVWQDGTDDE